MDRHASRTQASWRSNGFTLVDVMLSTVVLALGLAVYVHGVVSLKSSRGAATQKRSVAMALRGTIDRLQALGPTDAWLRYQPSAGGEAWPAPGSGPAEPITVQGLNHITEAGRAAEVEIEFVVDETAVRPELGLPRDLDGDGAISNTDVSSMSGGEIDAHILPFEVRVRWRADQGAPRSMVWHSAITSN